jgi:hypothetical protein
MQGRDRVIDYGDTGGGDELDGVGGDCSVGNVSVDDGDCSDGGVGGDGDVCGEGSVCGEVVSAGTKCLLSRQGLRWRN